MIKTIAELLTDQCLLAACSFPAALYALELALRDDCFQLLRMGAVL
jgi:hypothetical protein